MAKSENWPANKIKSYDVDVEHQYAQQWIDFSKWHPGSNNSSSNKITPYREKPCFCWHNFGLVNYILYHYHHHLHQLHHHPYWGFALDQARMIQHVQLIFLVILRVWDRNYFLLGDISSFYYYPFGTKMSATLFLFEHWHLVQFGTRFSKKKLIVKPGTYFQYRLPNSSLTPTSFWLWSKQYSNLNFDTMSNLQQDFLRKLFVKSGQYF